MNSSIFKRLWLFCLLVPAFAFGQIPAMKLKLQLIEDNTWGVYVKPIADITTGQTITIGGDQVTVVMPNDFAWDSLTSVHGNWMINSQLNGPIENPSKAYISFGFQSEAPPIPYEKGVSTLLFTFKGDGTCPDTMYVMDNITDPFNILPNSVGNNPGNEFAVFDMVNGNSFSYLDRYAPAAWDCQDNDGDGILNALEDTNGNGLYDAGVDVSNLNSDCDMAFTLDPKDATVCSGNDTTFLATASIPQGTFSFGWEFSADNGTTWAQIDFTTMAAIYTHTISGQVAAGTDVLSIKNVASQYGLRFRAVAHGEDCNDVYSNYAKLTVEGPITIVDQPDNITQCAGEAVSFTVGINNYTPGIGTLYQWEESTDGGLTWHNVINDTLYYGANSNQLEITYTTGFYEYKYRCRVSTSHCSQIISDAATLHVEGPMMVTQEPYNITQCSGSGVTFQAAVALQNGDPNTLIYQWEVSKFVPGSGPGTGFQPYINITNSGVYSGATATTLTISDVAGMNNWRYRMRYRTPNCNPQWSNYAQLTVEGPIDFAVGGHPDDYVTCSGNSAVFSVATTNNSAASIQYQWEILVDPLADTTDANNWIPLYNNSNYNGTKTANLSIANVADYNGFRFRAKIKTSTCYFTASYSALLTVEGPIFFTDQPDNIIQCSGESVTFSGSAAIAVGNAGTITYQWQWSDNAACVNYSNITATTGITNSISGYNTPTLTIGNITGLNGRCIRLAAKTGNCYNVYSSPATLTVGPTISVLTQPQSISICGDNPIQFQATFSNAGSSPINYQWERRTSTNSPWEQVVDDSIYAGSTSSILTIHSDDPIHDHHYRLYYSSSICNNGWTNEAALEYEPTCQPACIRLKLQLLPDSSGWAVMAKPQNGYLPSVNNMIGTGKVTIVTPANFVLSGLENGLGQWNLTNVVTSPAGHPNRRYLTIDLMSNSANQGLSNGETKLFQFDKTGACPDSLYLLETPIVGVSPNELVGQDNSFMGGFEYCGVYARKAWRCQGPNSPGGPIIFVGEDSLAAPQTEVSSRTADFTEGQTLAAGQYFNAQPNPAGDFVTIVISDKLAEGRPKLSLWDLQGKKRQEVSLENPVNQLNLSGLPTGVYLVSLAQNGRVVERKKLVKN